MSTRAGFVALIGEPNAGKSTLLNRMVGAKVSIVTHKVQTTRARIRGVAIEGEAQIVFVDTPGLFLPRRRLDRAMVAAAWSGAADADVVVLMVEAHRGISEGVERILEGLADIGKGRKIALAINKIDRVEAPVLLGLTKSLNERYDFVETFLISAEKGHGVDTLRTWLAGELPEGPWLYPEDQIADLPMRMIAAEMTREKLTLRLHQELPYQLTVETTDWVERKDGSAVLIRLCTWCATGTKASCWVTKARRSSKFPKPLVKSYRNFWVALSTCSCKSKSVPDGWTRPSDIPKWV